MEPKENFNNTEQVEKFSGLKEYFESKEYFNKKSQNFCIIISLIILFLMIIVVLSFKYKRY